MIGTKIKQALHLKGLRRHWSFYLINRVYAGTKPQHFEKKRQLLCRLGYTIGEGTKIVGPISVYGNLKIGKNCWIGKDFSVNGNGCVEIGDNCDLGPEVAFQTGGHGIGDETRRAGIGESYRQVVGNGTWIGSRVSVINNTQIGNACVVAACSCVTKDVPDNCLVGGVPAKIIRELDHEN